MAGGGVRTRAWGKRLHHSDGEEGRKAGPLRDSAREIDCALTSAGQRSEVGALLDLAFTAFCGDAARWVSGRERHVGRMATWASDTLMASDGTK